MATETVIFGFGRQFGAVAPFRMPLRRPLSLANRLFAQERVRGHAVRLVEEADASIFRTYQGTGERKS